MSVRSWMAASGVALALLLGAVGAGRSESADPPDDPANRKLNAYIGAYNALIGTFGLTFEARIYVNDHIATASPNTPGFGITDGWIAKDVDQLEAITHSPVELPELDAAAKALAPSARKVQQHLAALQPYYDAKKYLDDKLAHGRTEDPQMLAEIQTALHDLDLFDAALERAIDLRDEKDLERLKASGDLLGFDAKSALLHGKRLLKIVSARPAAGARAPDFAATTASADQELDQMEQAVADGTKRNAGQDGAYVVVFTSLNGMAGMYRTLKHSHNLANPQALYQSYNQAVDSLNNAN